MDGELARIEQKLDALAEGQSEIKNDVAVLKSDVAVLKDDLTALQLQVADQRVHMGVLHEDAIARIQQVAEGHEALKVQIARGFEGLHAVIHQRLEPLEQTVRELYLKHQHPQ